MRTRCLIGAALAVVLAAPNGASAQQLGISAGLSVPRGALRDESGTGFNVNGIFNVAFPASIVGFRAEAGINSFALKGTDRGTTRIASVAGNIVIGAAADDAAHPYLIGGIGVYRVNYSSGSKNVLYPQGPITVSRNGTDTRMGFNGGVGVWLLTGRAGGLWFEARYVALAKSGQHPSAPFIPISVGVLF